MATLSLILKVSITLETALLATSSLPYLVIEPDLSNKMMIFLAPDAAMVYQGR